MCFFLYDVEKREQNLFLFSHICVNNYVLPRSFDLKSSFANFSLVKKDYKKLFLSKFQCRKQLFIHKFKRKQAIFFVCIFSVKIITSSVLKPLPFINLTFTISVCTVLGIFNKFRYCKDYSNHGPDN